METKLRQLPHMFGRGNENAAWRTKINHRDQEAYYREWCREIKGAVRVPVIAVGGLRTFELMEEIVGEGDADLVSLSRPLIREPGIINAWKESGRQRAACISCNMCVRALVSERTLYCAQQRTNETG